MSAQILRMESVSKNFPGVCALDGVSMELLAGEVHVLIGENGAGKSTLMKILAGHYQLDSGSIWLEGRKTTISTPRDALKHGVVMIHQELTPIPEMTVAENIFVGREPLRFGMVDREKMNRDAAELLSRLECGIMPRVQMKTLSIAGTQMVEISKALSRSPRIIIMDEPTSAIMEEEVEKLFAVIRLLKGSGVGIIYISHKLNEIYRIGDRITVLRDGRHICTRAVSELPKTELISLMVGRKIEDIYPKREVKIGEEMLAVEELSSRGVFENVGFNVRAGEIFGIAGLMGSGRTEIVETICGARRKDSGTVSIRGKPVSITSPRDSIRLGISFVTEDRKRLGLNLKASVKENLTLLKLKDLGRGGVIDSRAEAKLADAEIARLDIKTPSREKCVAQLSGGNQQKVVISKWLLAEPSVLILDEPTRGIDVGAKAEIYRLIAEFASAGMAVIMVSSELPEIIGMCDRVLVMHEGEAMGCVPRSGLTQENIMHLATGNPGGCTE